MNIDTYVRRVQSGFGDYNGVIIKREEILDWLNEAQSTVARETQCIKTTLQTAASTFPIIIEDLYLLDRAQYGTAPLEFISTESLDLWFSGPVDGTPRGFYFDGSSVNIFPKLNTPDSTVVTISYVPEPTQYTLLTDGEDEIQVPLPYHQDMVIFGLSRAHEKNENYKAAELKMGEFQKNIAMRSYEIQHGSDSSSYIQLDPYDYPSYGMD